MSLLLDALKRAEQAKQSRQSSPLELASPEVASAPAAPASPATPAVSSTLTLEDIPPPPGALQSGVANHAESRESAQNLFAAKQLAPPTRSSINRWIVPGVVVIMALLSAGGWYVWREVTRLGGGTVAMTPVAPPPAQVPKASGVVTPAPTISTPPPPDMQVPALPPKDVPLPARVTSPKPAGNDSNRARDELMRSLKASQAAAEAPLALKLTTGIEPPRVSAELAAAYTALRSGNHGEAKRLYTNLIAADAMNLDAHLGLATALARTNDLNAAIRAYRKALEIDPRNSTALAGLVVLSDQGNRPALEADLRTLLVKYPDSAALAFALGNLMASQSRWTEAQQAYFDAFRFEPENADYAFNLAVSLDHLKQLRIAHDYYQKALALAGRGGAQFDRAQTQRRANELKSQL